MIARNRQRGYIQQVVANFRVDEFKTFFRVSRVTVQCLQEWIIRVSEEENITGIIDRRNTGGSLQKPLGDRILMMLWYMASLDRYSSMADRFGMSESTACDAITNLLCFIKDYLMDRLITWPSIDEIREIKDMYMELKNFEGIVGMIDGTHIAIHKPKERGIDYYNRKDYYSVVLQAVVREDMRFTDVYCGWPGKVHDARIFRQSPICEKGQALCQGGHILGDSAYPNLSWLLVPFRDNGNLTQAQRHYNLIHSSIRSTVERAFGLLKGRFTRLQHLDQRRDIEKVVTTVLSACVLHNICILNNDEFEDLLEEPIMPQEEPNIINLNANEQEIGATKRLRIAHTLNINRH